MILVPMSIVSTSYSQVFFNKISKVSDRQMILRQYLKSATLLGFGSIVFLFFVQMINKEIVTFIFGQKWGAVTSYLKALSFWFAIQFVASSLSSIYIRLRKLKINVVFDIVHILLIFGSIYIGFYHYNSYKVSLYILIATKAFFYSTSIVLAIYFIRKVKAKDLSIH